MIPSDSIAPFRLVINPNPLSQAFHLLLRRHESFFFPRIGGQTLGEEDDDCSLAAKTGKKGACDPLLLLLLLMREMPASVQSLRDRVRESVFVTLKAKNNTKKRRKK